MNEYYCAFLKALSDGSIERRTDTENGEEAILRNGSLIASTSAAVSADLIEIVKAEPHLILFGSGHVGKALYDLGVLQKMRMTILDDRPELLTKERFPLAERHIAPFEDLLKKDYDAVAPAWIVFTHGHSYDTDCLRYALKRPASYIGMIGSKAKSARALEQLRSEGFGDELIQSVHTPIGLPIGAETPEEIAAMAEADAEIERDFSLTYSEMAASDRRDRQTKHGGQTSKPHGPQTGRKRDPERSRENLRRWRTKNRDRVNAYERERYKARKENSNGD